MDDASIRSTLLKKGAEASLYLEDWHGRRVVVKVRLPKKYRPKQLDLTIRRYRTVHEPQLMHDAKRAGVPTPTVFMVDVENSAIVMDYIEGKPVKLLLDSASKTDQCVLCQEIGALTAKLHEHGLIHGDLTTSNMILASDGRVFFVDFGLGDRSEELEAKGVDLHLLRRALQSTHFNVADDCFNAVLKGYASVAGSDKTHDVLRKIREIEKKRPLRSRKAIGGVARNLDFNLKGKMAFFASGNIHKFNEVRVVLAEYGLASAMLRIKGAEIQSDDIREIAVSSAKAAFKQSNLPLIVEDAGLFVDALKGFPGPYAAYVHKTIENAGLLKLMEGVSNRRAVFRSAVAYCDSLQGATICFEGETEGVVAAEEQKASLKSAFGFDPIFRPQGSQKTFAMMKIEEKNTFSHRAVAVRKFAEWYKKQH